MSCRQANARALTEGTDGGVVAGRQHKDGKVGSLWEELNILGEVRAHHPGGLTREVGNALAFKQPTWPYDMESGPGGLTREVGTVLVVKQPT